MIKIHPTAIVDPTAELGDDVEVKPYAIIEANVVIGEGSVIGPHCVVGAGTLIGKNNVCYSGAQIGVPPQDLKHLGHKYGRTIVGDNNIFREFVTVSSSTVYSETEDELRKATRIGSNCLFMACTHVAHDCKVGDYVIMANGSALAGHVVVEDYATIGGLSGIHQFCTVGQYSFVGGMSRVSKDVLPYMITEGYPAQCFGPNVIGLQRRGFSNEAIARIKEMYRIIYRSQYNLQQAVQVILEKIPDSLEKTVILEFISRSKRGISKGPLTPADAVLNPISDELV
ncbi:MAG: acyl-ACP--UDP-N-acetylglucosamine O-acyltransferase [Candidatus Hydrogenedentes bacterium]|nr:acyl-ACP--UDP-N-acetylglucosamine O-acyltransferase [Candidatus Hydrogenedentota bacterium]